MMDTDLYRKLLGIAKPWLIERVELNMAEERVDIWLKHDRSLEWHGTDFDRVPGIRPTEPRG